MKKVRTLGSILTDGCTEYWNDSSEEECENDLETKPRDVQHEGFGDQEIFLMRKVYALSDAGTKIMLKFFVTLFGVLGKMFPPLSFILQFFPTFTYHLRSYGTLKKFRRLVVCQKCDNIYTFEDCKEGNLSKRCSFIPFLTIHIYE